MQTWEWYQSTACNYVKIISDHLPCISKRYPCMKCTVGYASLHVDCFVKPSSHFHFEQCKSSPHLCQITFKCRVCVNIIMMTSTHTFSLMWTSAVILIRSPVKNKNNWFFLLEDSQLKPAWTVKSSKQKLFSSVNTVSKSLTARREDEEK